MSWRRRGKRTVIDRKQLAYARGGCLPGCALHKGCKPKKAKQDTNVATKG